MNTRMLLTIPVPVPHDVFNALCDYLDEVRCRRDIAIVAGDAITAWIAQGRKRAAEAPGKVEMGYQWKQVFLPAGTRLKTCVRGETQFALVEGNRIMLDGRAVSPHEFANAFGVSGRNAWRDVWVHLPYDESWRPAASLKRRPPAEKAVFV
ncbi:MAG TPA: hypothetical protein VFT37_02285 [Telluria sp.]|nr:hypothetical protein [Telluria sp.]